MQGICPGQFDVEAVRAFLDAFCDGMFPLHFLDSKLCMLMGSANFDVFFVGFDVDTPTPVSHPAVPSSSGKPPKAIVSGRYY